ncbi:hypothetical protein [Aeromicrobium ginsengisoli]|uniref:DUF885 domain-containing protein n=1 Tax=Aeromicrobium ginsengisoli TaxID=363867 RepID=A0A5M4FIM3_9ACTN|nr:hypothetical protein [Aeromicrobium ginsengisoli]KAA1399987.1 hypothetical protein ESP70_004345 [Aeromicrobium ginsengisoli]
MRARLRLALLATFVIGLVLSGLGSVVAKSPEQRDQINDADRVAQRFEAVIDAYVVKAAAKVKSEHDADQDGYPALLDVVQNRIADAPRLRAGSTTAYGREHSGAYEDAGPHRASALAPLKDLELYLRTQAIPNSRFIAAGKKLVALRPGTLLGDEAVVNGDPLRERVLPAYEKARNRLKKQNAPEGAELLRLDLMTYANDIVSMTKDGAKKIDEQKAFFFQLGDRPVELFKRLAAMETAIQVQVSQQVEIVAAAQ